MVHVNCSCNCPCPKFSSQDLADRALWQLVYKRNSMGNLVGREIFTAVSKDVFDFWSWGGRHHAGTLSADGREVTPLALADAGRGVLGLIEHLAAGGPLPPANGSGGRVR